MHFQRFMRPNCCPQPIDNRVSESLFSSNLNLRLSAFVGLHLQVLLRSLVCVLVRLSRLILTGELLISWISSVQFAHIRDVHILFEVQSVSFESSKM